MVSTTRVSSKGQVVIPKPLREELELKPGDPLAVAVDGDTLVLRKITLSNILDATLRHYHAGKTLSHTDIFEDLL